MHETMQMDIYEIRRHNLKALIGKRKKSACAELWDTSASLLSQILPRSGAPVRNLGDELARKIEAAELLPHGYLDQLHDADQSMAGSADGVPNLAKSNVIKMMPPRHSEVRLIGTLASWGSDTVLEDDEVEVPLFREVELAAGNGSTAIREIPGCKIRFRRSTLRDAGVDPANAIAAQVYGNSMERVIFDGSTIGIDIGTKNIFDGEIYAIDHDGMLRIKYVYRLPGGGLRLKSENDKEYPDEHYTSEEAAQIRIIGWVFWWSTVRRRRQTL